MLITQSQPTLCNPLQCSCLENPRDGGAWWAAIYGVTQSRTWLKWLSSSSSSTITLQLWFYKTSLVPHFKLMWADSLIRRPCPQKEWFHNLIFITPPSRQQEPILYGVFTSKWVFSNWKVVSCFRQQLLWNILHLICFCWNFYLCMERIDCSHFASSWLFFSYFIKVKLTFLNLLIILFWILVCLAIIKVSQVLHNIEWSDYFF